MTNRPFSTVNFELEFEVFERNRMYPPSHTGETMISISDCHLRSIARATYFMESGIVPNMSPKTQENIRRDIVKLNEVHKFCRQQIKEPGLPMQDVPEAVLKVGDSIGNANTKAAH